MFALDFAYDGQHLSDYGFLVCKFNHATGANAASAGSKITFKTVPYNRGRIYSLSNTQYDECLQATFDICKNPDIYDSSEMWITNDEYRDLMRWLNRNQFLKFQIIFEDDPNASPCFYEGSFNVEKITINEILYGLRLTFISNRPYGFGMERIHKLIFDDITMSRSIRDFSDDVGNTYPFLNITCKADGDLTITNDLTGCSTEIKNCVSDEIITLDCFNQIICSSNESHDICNDFNYDFFSIGNTIDNRENKIKVSLPCTIELRYFPIIKDTP